MIRAILVSRALLVAACVFTAALPCAVRADGVGVILMHGKNGTNRPGSPVGKLGGDFKVDVPEMLWSRDRDFDKTLSDAFKEIDAAVARLKDAGATKVVIGGHSLGAAAALAYASQRG
ncbi:MAG: hypothetical protein VW268_05630 [Rhodospirillaceae bacterium]